MTTAPKKRMTNERDFVPDPNYVAADPEKEKLLLDLACMITNRIKAKLTHSVKTEDPEYWMLDELLTKEEVKFMLSFKKTRVGYKPEVLAKKNNMTLEETQKMIEHLCWIGLIEMNRENPENEKQYNVPIFVPGSAEFMMMNDELTEAHPNLATFFNLMTQIRIGLHAQLPFLQE